MKSPVGTATERTSSLDAGGLPDVPVEPAASGAVPAWYTPARLLVAFCVVETLVFLDRGVIASNGVNGDKDSKSGIQVKLYILLLLPFRPIDTAKNISTYLVLPFPAKGSTVTGRIWFEQVSRWRPACSLHDWLADSFTSLLGALQALQRIPSHWYTLSLTYQNKLKGLASTSFGASMCCSTLHYIAPLLAFDLFSELLWPSYLPSQWLSVCKNDKIRALVCTFGPFSAPLIAPSCVTYASDYQVP